MFTLWDLNMLITVLKAKLHHLRVTQADLEYQGSLTIDEDLMDAVGLVCFEKILIAVMENGNRLETYAIPGPRGSGVACLNGAAAHLGAVGHRLIVMAFGQMSAEEARGHQPKVVRLGPDNRTLAPAY
jgi:aspartate 1-decarboxylase